METYIMLSFPDFPGMCFASTRCATVEPGNTWDLAPFCGRSTCVVSEDTPPRLLELVEDCGPLPLANPKCKLDTDLKCKLLVSAPSSSNEDNYKLGKTRVAGNDMPPRLLELIEDCGPLPLANPKCKIETDKTNKTAPFPGCCPIFTCEDGAKLEYPELPTPAPEEEKKEEKEEKPKA
ncbi:hypothetical protein MSG28_015350 [Choristoneura fumiferana]|uniref:Uncharacterized protein n=1 Tax=Choristoneura fumiferana TaxID=7141 RepID=A0ACC0KA26_CHOFU|nr:hypothetical protein MSG28_015350 [Choristoneura fumiferana]